MSESLEREFAGYAEIYLWATVLKEFQALQSHKGVPMTEWLSMFEGAAFTLIVKGDIAKFINTVFGLTAEEVGEFFKNELGNIRLKRVAKAFAEAYKTLENAGIEPHKVGLKIISPIIEGIGIEEDEDLQKRWQNLLTSAISGAKIHPSYPSILRDISSLEAKILDKVGQLKTSVNGLGCFYNINELTLFLELCEEMGFDSKFKDRYSSPTIEVDPEVDPEDEIERIKIEKDSIGEGVDNLVRLNLLTGKGERENGFSITGHLTLSTWGYPDIDISPLGRRFLNSVSPQHFIDRNDKST